MGFFDIFKVSQYKSDIELLKKEVTSLRERIETSGVKDYEDAQRKISNINDDISEKEKLVSNLTSDIDNLNAKYETTSKQLNTQTKKLSRVKELYNSIEYAHTTFQYDVTETKFLSSSDLEDIEKLSPSVMLKLHSMDIKDLRKAYKENEKLIDKVLESYSSRYTTKANKTIYSLMVIALRAELQNILYSLKYEKLDNSIDNVKKITNKYFNIAKDGNQNIASTLSKFIGEIEYLFINAVKIEYNYYVRKEQAKQEQIALRQQMREEAEERKLLEQQQKQVEKEEQKYHSELEKIKENLINADEEKTAELNKRILELEAQLANVAVKKDEIVKLQHGKAGSVYVISNLGSFGENVFKIGMTRRLDPIDRINELGNASVPFKFDVHSLIFSDDAVALENKLHQILNEKRVNKVNLRKEFFNTSIDELEQLVNEIEPTAEFNKTMLAEEFRQSMSSSTVYGSTSSFYDNEDDDEE